MTRTLRANPAALFKATREAVGSVKSGKEHIVDLPDQGLDALRALRSKATSMQWVLATRSGKTMGRRRLYGEPSKKGKRGRGFAFVREQAAKRGVSPNRTIHSARHSFASLAIEAGLDDEWIRGQLGHHSSDYTRRSYAHVLSRRRDLSFAEFEVSG